MTKFEVVKIAGKKETGLVSYDNPKDAEDMKARLQGKRKDVRYEVREVVIAD